MKYIHAHSKRVYFLIILYSVFVILISSFWDIGGFLPRPLFEVTNYLLDWMVFTSKSLLSVVSTILLVVLLLIVWIPLMKKQLHRKKIICALVAVFCLFDAMLLIYYGSSSHKPLSLHGNETLFDAVYVWLDTICDLFMAYIVFIRIGLNGTKASGTQSYAPNG